MTRPAIIVKDLKKVYRTHKRGEGLWQAIKSVIKRKYEYKKALKGVSFTIEEGEIVGLIGPNGAGKSTTIKALSGILHPSSGTVEVLGYTPWEDRVDYVQNIGVVFGQKPQLVWDLPPLDTYALNKDLYRIPKSEFEKRQKYMIKLLGLEKVVDTPVRDLSLGERMKCKLVGALLHKPKLVFLDEPSIGLDVVAKDLMRDFIIDVNKKDKTTFIITTHDMQDIERLCKRVIIINYGEIVYDGPLENIKKHFMKNKLVTVKCESELGNFRYEGCTVVDRQKYEIKVEVDTTKTSIKNVIDHMIKTFDCADLIIEDPPIEQVIQKIFKAKRKDVMKH